MIIKPPPNSNDANDDTNTDNCNNSSNSSKNNDVRGSLNLREFGSRSTTGEASIPDLGLQVCK